MKVFNNITKLGVVSAMLFMSACDPIEDRDTLTNSYQGTIDLSVEQTANGTGNGLTLTMNTPGVSGWWDYILNKKNTNEVYVVFPFTGTHRFYYEVSTPYMVNGNPANQKNVIDSIDVTVDVLDQRLPEPYYALIGENLEGKNWVFKGTGGDNQKWWYMSPPNDPGAWETAWWNAGGECCPPGDAAGHMRFDLAGAPNFTHFANDGDAGTLGRFAFNGDYSKLLITGNQKILGNNPNGGTGSGEYQIIKLTEDELVLYVPLISGTGWTWVFVPEE